jgi:hypothetical protein
MDEQDEYTSQAPPPIFSKTSENYMLVRIPHGRFLERVIGCPQWANGEDLFARVTWMLQANA